MHKEWDVEDAQAVEARKEANTRKRQELEAKAAEEEAAKKQKLAEGAPSDPGKSHSVCRCGVPLEKRSVQKNGPNWGRAYMTCAKGKREFGGCGFFEWISEESAVSTNTQAEQMIPKKTPAEDPGAKTAPVESAPSGLLSLCRCGLQVERKTVQTNGPNYGRVYMSCSKGKREFGGCGYFSWISEEAAASSNGKAIEDSTKGRVLDKPGVSVEILCKCGVQVVKKTCQKNGQNFGRTFLACEKGKREYGGCSFFLWEASDTFEAGVCQAGA